MTSFRERLIYAMECRQMHPNRDQTHLAKLVGYGCKPQNIQHMLDPDKNARSSKYTPMLAAVLQCDPMWLATGQGNAPQHTNTQGEQQVQSSPEPQAIDTGTHTPHTAEVTPIWWPWSISPQRLAALPPEFFARLDGYVEGRVQEFERTHRPHQAVAVGERATSAKGL